MEPIIWGLIVAALIVVALAAAFALKRHRSTHLRERFGDEYDRTVETTGKRSLAERELERREERVAHLDIRPLSATDRSRFLERWGVIQSRFVDEPRASVAEADELLEEVMRARGYPTEDFEHNAADLSVHHPAFVESYRAAYTIKARRGDGQATTEELRRAMIHYRALFAHLLEDGVAEEAEPHLGPLPDAPAPVRP
jgi:hypothetical protein